MTGIKHAGTRPGRLPGPRWTLAILLMVAGCQSDGAGILGDTIVSVPPHAPTASRSPLTAVPSVSVAVLVHERPLGTGALPGRIGERNTIGNISMGFVTIEPPPAQLVSDALSAELRTAGHGVSSTASIRLGGEVKRFLLRTDVTALYWDVLVEAEVGVTLSSPGHGASGTYRSDCMERTYLGPSNALMASVVARCVADIARKFRDDQEMAHVLATR